MSAGLLLSRNAMCTLIRFGLNYWRYLKILSRLNHVQRDVWWYRCTTLPFRHFISSLLHILKKCIANIQTETVLKWLKYICHLFTWHKKRWSLDALQSPPLFHFAVILSMMPPKSPQSFCLLEECYNLSLQIREQCLEMQFAALLHLVSQYFDPTQFSFTILQVPLFCILVNH